MDSFSEASADLGMSKLRLKTKVAEESSLSKAKMGALGVLSNTAATLISARVKAHSSLVALSCLLLAPVMPILALILAILLVLTLLTSTVQASPYSYPLQSWEAGRLDYANGGSEVAAFVNTPEQVQLQIVLCSQFLSSPYRMSLLLPHAHNCSGIIPVELIVDGETTHVYAEVNDNSLEFQVGTTFLITLPESPNFEMVFSKEDAKQLKIPRRISFPMNRADLALSEIARSCRILKEKQHFSLNDALISGILWPRHGFNSPKLNQDLDNGYESIGSDPNANANGSSSRDDEGIYDDSVPIQEQIQPRYINIDRLCLRYMDGPNGSARSTYGQNNEASSLQTNSSELEKSSVKSDAQTNKNTAHKNTGKTASSSGSNNTKALYAPVSKVGLVSAVPKNEREKVPTFVLSEKCRTALDQVYEQQGKDALSFLPELFSNPTGAYQRYAMLWNNVLLDTSRMDFNTQDKELDDFDYYLTLFSLFSDTKITQYPQSYYDILRLKDDPATFLYALDNRYELETIKYASVLDRRLKSFLSPRTNAQEALSSWYQFYNEFSQALPPIGKAQALRPVLYRQMLMRVWRLAGHPETLHLLPKYSFIQGSQGKTITQEPLEAKCSVFEGTEGDQFFFASSDCVKSIANDLRNIGFINNDYNEVLDNWDRFARAWQQSIFHKESGQDAVGEHMRSSLALTLLSLYKSYGFGDYFLVRKCISSRDSDICAFEANKYFEGYNSDLRKTISSIAEVSKDDARALKDLNELWNRYFDSLCRYTNNLAQKNRIPLWRAYLVQGVAATVQAEAVINSLSYPHTDMNIASSYDDDF